MVDKILSTMVVKIVMSIIILHLIVGFGWMIYKLSPQPGDEDELDSDD